MAFNKKTIRDIDIKGKTVLLRADYNVPLEAGQIKGDYRIEQSLPTLNYLLDHNCKIIICSHLGRPDGQPDKKYSLKPLVSYLKQLVGRDILFAPDCIGPEAQQMAASLKPGQILLLENLRFHAEEEQNDAKFAEQLAKLAQLLVQDGFGVVHRKHASTDAITRYLPSVAGLLLAKEVDAITEVMENPQRPLMTIVGGAKIADKMDILNKFVDIADFVAIGGGMANTFLLAEGVSIGKSLSDKDDLPLARQIMDKARAKAKKQRFVFYLPQDGVVAKQMDKKTSTRVVGWAAHIIADIESYPKQPPQTTMNIEPEEAIFDIGPMSASFIAGGLQMVDTVIWNGTMGVTEVPAIYGQVGPFAHGTQLIIEAIGGKFGHRPRSLVGGGDTASYIENQGQTKYFDHLSTGGGASLELMCGKKLPGVEALQDK